MKKIFTLLFAAMTAIGSYAQTNLFDAADCDADGWLWFDTEAKIAKYVGNATDKQDANGFDWQNYTVNPNGKPIQLAFANITPDYPESFANEAIEGTDAAGYIAGQEQYVAGQAKTGAIVLAGASAIMSTNGGCLILNLPSCSTISLFMSSESRYLGRTLMITPGHSLAVDEGSGENPWTGYTKSIYAKASVLGSLHGAGQWQWDGIESLNNGYNEGVTFVSDNPVYFALQNCQKDPIYIHGIKVTLPSPAGISRVAANQGKAEYFTLDGRRMQQAHGLTIVRENGVVRKVLK
jgi:hypothetical protein